ncbi:Stk1 family PASTA domain-containing Ser/Thr kinase [Thermophilibacter sp. ZX-H3]|uniref:Stk1 family PASTA domain-containing Ser/Thr kinase n=1 Tax=unclassified Thermophilibacter TaxID=2847308 RepID=UPI004040B86E
MPGMILGGRYQVQDKIGTGGMATVFRGLDEVLGRTVAIKTMLPQYAADPSFAARFKQEAQAAAALQSPYIVSVYDWGKDADTYYIVMEYLRGTDLKSGIRKHGALDCKKVAQIGSQIAQALSVAHKHDIIHRDIKPQNIMVQPDGNIKVMDFGIARAKNSHLTQDNSVLGTAHYVSPEQTQGKELGPTTDIYSLGIVMYEAATGQVPFQGDDAITVALKQVNEQPKPPSQLNPSVDPALESIILKCMQKNPADRFQTADELFRTLRDYLAGRVQAVNSATAMLPIQPTNKLERGTGAIPATGSTASIPRVERTNRYRAQSATEQAAEEEAERQRRHRRNVILGVIGVIAVVAVAAVALFSIFGSGTQTKPVPNLIGLTQEQAIKAIEDNGFEVGKVEQGYTSAQDPGLVYEQNPLATRAMPEGSSIDIRVSKGEAPAEKVTVPDLTNLPEDQVEDELAKYNLKGRKGEDQESDSIEKGRVCAQDTPEGTEVNVGETITYHISSGASTAVIPNVVGDYYEDAQERLSSSDGEFDVKVVWDYSNTVAEGNVISVDPAAGNTAEVGSTVTITVSSGPKPVENVPVPYVVGKSYYDARAQLQNLGFVVQLASGSSAEGVVVNQSAWESLPEGGTIVLTTEVQSTGNEGGGSNTGTEGGGNSSTGDNQGGTSGEGTGTDIGNGVSVNSRSSSRQKSGN